MMLPRSLRSLPRPRIALHLLAALATVAASQWACARQGEGQALANAPAAPAAAAYVMWGGDQPSSAFIAADGHVVRRVPGIVIADGGHTFRVHNTQVSVPTRDCDGRASEGRGESLTLVKDTGEAVIISPEPLPSDVPQAYQSSAEVVASVGPYVFVRRHTYVYRCAALGVRAQGDSSSESFVWDLTLGKTVARTSQHPDDESLGLRAATQLHAQREQPLEWVELVPTFKADARLALGVRFVVPAGPSQADAEWSSRTRSTLVSTDVLPDFLATREHAPLPVSRAARQIEQEGPVRGYSAL
jgi:hypothetical protein